MYAADSNSRSIARCGWRCARLWGGHARRIGDRAFLNGADECRPIGLMQRGRLTDGLSQQPSRDPCPTATARERTESRL
jgi:hypothetical protein